MSEATTHGAAAVDAGMADRLGSFEGVIAELSQGGGSGWIPATTNKLGGLIQGVDCFDAKGFKIGSVFCNYGTDIFSIHYRNYPRIPKKF